MRNGGGDQKDVTARAMNLPRRRRRRRWQYLGCTHQGHISLAAAPVCWGEPGRIGISMLGT